MKNIKNFILQPLNICIIFLSLLSLGAVYSRISDNLDVLLNILFSLSTILLIHTFIPWILSYFKIKVVNTKDSIISSLILFLVIDPMQSILNILILSLLVFAVRMIVRYKAQPIFNPVASGIGVALFFNIFLNIKPFISWWGASFSPRLTDFNISIVMIPVAIVGIYLAYRFRKLIIAATVFILAPILFFLYQILIIKPDSADLLNNVIYSLFEGTFVFGVLIMLLEPKTSPTKKNYQIIYGIIFSVSWIALLFFKIGNALILAIIICNAFNLITKMYSFSSIAKKIPTQSTATPSTQTNIQN